MHARNESPEKHQCRVSGHESSPNRTSARGRRVREVVQTESRLSVSLPGIEAGGICRRPEGHSGSRSAHSKTGRRAVKIFDFFWLCGAGVTTCGKTKSAVILSEAKNLSLFLLMPKSKRDSSLRSE